MRKGNLKGEKGRPIVSIGLLAMNCAKKAVPIEMQFAILSWVGSGTHVLFGGAYWRHLVNTNKPPVCSLGSRYFDHLLSFFHLETQW